MHTLSFIRLCLLGLAAPILAQQLQQEKATGAITVRHIPNPSAGYLWQHPEDKSIWCKWTYTAQDSAGNVYHAEEEIGLTPVLRYHAGDDTAWADPEFDDRSWETTNTRFQPINPPKSGWNGIGWFRLHVAVDSTLWDRPLALNVGQLRGAAEISQFGKVGSSQRDLDLCFSSWTLRQSFFPTWVFCH